MLSWARYHHDNPWHDLVDVEEDYENGFKVDTCDMSPWNKQFVAQYDRSTIYQILSSTSVVGLKGLTDVCAKTVASWIRGKSPGEIREALGLQNDFTAEDEDRFRREAAERERVLSMFTEEDIYESFHGADLN